MAVAPTEHVADAVLVPARLPTSVGDEQSTQSAFGRIQMNLAQAGDTLGDRIVTTAPDVTQTTNLGGFVNRRGLFRRRELEGVFHATKNTSAQKWSGHGAGQHIELGIAENNFFPVLTALGLSAPQSGTRLLPVGTGYPWFGDRRALTWLNGDPRFEVVKTRCRTEIN